ncbi:hypothetical protein [Mycoplasmoides genitalium]|uniref:hypothetical protein n=1 Tax=Mycoplasmoides genitalium TaxID=2097 RepID=UPI0000557D3A|nr:hypothetical protein [Mycoplasmoides genitalium]
MQTNKQPKQQFSEKQFIAFVFNYIAGFGFISVVMTMFDVGPFSYLVLGLTSFAILGVVLSFLAFQFSVVIVLMEGVI